jgi:hypothetical protein
LPTTSDRNSGRYFSIQGASKEDVMLRVCVCVRVYVSNVKVVVRVVSE